MQKINVAVNNDKQKAYDFAKWSIFSVLILTYILVYFHRMAPGVVSEYLMGAFQTTGTELGALSAIYFFVYAFMQVPSGVIADTLGTRMSVINGNLVAGTGSIVFGLSESFAMACLGRFLVGLGVSVVFVAIMKSNSVWFHERVFAFMSGVTLLVGNLGSVLAAGPLAALLTTFAWRNVFMGIGAFSLLLAVLGYMLVKNKPEDLGFEPPNTYRVNESNLTSGSWFTNLISVVSAWRVWPGFWVQFGMIGSLYSFMGLWGIRYLQDVHTIDRTLAARHMTVMLLCFAAGALFFGWLSDRIGRRKPIIKGCVLGYLVSWLILIYVSWSPGAEGYVLFGFMGLMGAGFVVTFAAAKEVIHPHLSGMAVSVVNTGCFIGTAIMQPLFGYIVDRSWDGHVVGGVRLYSAGDYSHSFLLVLVFAVIAVIGAFRLQETNCKNIMAENCR
jgi:sugar phosphate permease